MDGEAELDWEMSRAGEDLEVRYRVTNRSAKTIYVCDGLLDVIAEDPAAYRRIPGRPVVKEGRQAGLAQLILGGTDASSTIYSLPSPTYRPLSAGESYEASMRLPLPLLPWHNVGWVAPFKVQATAVMLIIEYLADEPEWETLQAERGEPIQVPASIDKLVRWLETEPRPIP